MLKYMHQKCRCGFCLLTSLAFEACDTNMQSCCELWHAVALVTDASSSPPEEGNELKYNRGSYQVLVSVAAPSYRPRVMTTWRVSGIAICCTTFSENRIWSSLFSLSFRISSPPKISCFLISVTLQKNIKDAAVSQGMKMNVKLRTVFKKESVHFQLQQLGVCPKSQQKPRTQPLQGELKKVPWDSVALEGLKHTKSCWQR